MFVYSVFFDFRNVVSDIVYKAQAEFFRWPFEHLLKALAHPMGDRLAVGESIVDSAGHGLIVVFSLFACARCASELSIRQDNLVLVNCSLHDAQVVGAYLVAVSARAAVNHSGDLALTTDAESFGNLRVVNFANFLNLEKMVSRS